MRQFLDRATPVGSASEHIRTGRHSQIYETSESELSSSDFEEIGISWLLLNTHSDSGPKRPQELKVTFGKSSKVRY